MLWRSKVNGSERLQLTSPPMQAASPRWSPDGKRICFVGISWTQAASIYTVSAEGGEPQLLVNEGHALSDAEWSPDGNYVLFASFAGFDAEVGIRTFDMKTHQVSKLPNSEGLYSPRWSPDGRYVAANEFVGGKVVVFDFKTHKWVRLTKGSADLLAWSVDGQYLYFTSDDSNTFYDVRISDRKLEAAGKSTKRPVGSWVGVTPDGSPILLRNIGTQEIYALDWEAP